MSIKSRLIQLEKAAKELRDKTHPPRVFIFYEDQEPEDLATARPGDTVIKICYVDLKNTSGADYTAGIAPA